MILLHSTPGAEEDKKHNDGTSSYLAHLREKHNTPFKVTEQKYIDIDDHPSAYMTLQQPSKVC